MHLEIILQTSVFRRFAGLFQTGIRVKALAGVTLHDFLLREVGLTDAYVEQRIATAFFDGRPVDDLKSVQLSAGSTIGLSGAMPGLAGAILRRGTPLAIMRSPGIGYPACQPHSSQTVQITVKLFNLMIDELGPVFLSRGVVLRTGEELSAFIERVKPDACSRFVLNKKRLSPLKILSGIRSLKGSEILVSVTILESVTTRKRETVCRLL